MISLYEAIYVYWLIGYQLHASIPYVTVFYFYSCWLSDEDGTIWAFVAPMLLIILVSWLVISMVDMTVHLIIHSLHYEHIHTYINTFKEVQQ